MPEPKPLTFENSPRSYANDPRFRNPKLLSLADCQTILDVFYRDRPEKKNELRYFFFDEIQNISNWERFVRRLMLSMIYKTV